MSRVEFKKIKVILLDLGGVVFQKTGLSNTIIKWDVINQLNEKLGEDMNIGKTQLSTFLSDYSYATSQYLGEGEFLKAIFDTMRFNEELISLLEENHDIIIVSDNYKENIEYISQRFNFSDWSVSQVYSFDYQMLKSDKEFFKKFIHESEYKAEEMLLVDNNSKNINKAKSNGINGILYTNNDQFALEFIGLAQNEES